MVVFNRSFKLIPSKDAFLVVMLTFAHKEDPILILLCFPYSASTSTLSSNNSSFSIDEIEALCCLMANLQSPTPTSFFAQLGTLS